MGIIFSDKARHVQIKDLLGSPQGRVILNRLQAGRDGGDIMGFGSVPHRLSQEDLELLKDEWIYFEANDDCWYARFEKPVNEIRAILGLEPQDTFGHSIKKDESLEETLERNPLDLYFEDVNIYGEKLTEAKEEVCCICGEPIEGYGNNPEPYKHEGKCCDACNAKFVIPARLAELGNKEE